MAAAARTFQHDLALAMDVCRRFDTTKHGWELLELPNASSTLVETYIREGPPEKLEVNFRVPLPVPVETATSVMRALGANEQEDSPWPGMMEKFVCLKHFGPGDMICSIQFTKWYVSLLDLLFGKKAPESLGTKLLMRLVVKRDFPKLGQTSFTSIALDGTVLFFGNVFTKARDSSGCIQNMVLQFPKSPPDVYLPVLEQLGRLYSPEPWKEEIAETVDNRYGFVVMTIRKCSRGPPLVPIPPAEGNLETFADEWFNALTWEMCEDPSTFSLSWYLRLVLDCFGKRNLEVFETLDGRNLAFYQASARRSDWLEIWGIIDAFCRRQASAYRRMLGGTTAPIIQGDTAPRFGKKKHVHPEADAPTILEDTSEESDDYPWTWSLPVKNTFVHFPTNEGDCEIGSCPP